MGIKKSNNKGYSLVEMIIVIAIIGVVSGMALASVSMIRSAKAKDASVVFNSEISELVAMAKSMNDNNGICAVRIFRNTMDNTVYIQRGTVKKDGTNYKFKISPENGNDYNGRPISKYVSVCYIPETEDLSGNPTGMPASVPANWSDAYDTQWDEDNGIVADGSIGSVTDGENLQGRLISVAKSGDVLVGNGIYGFYRRNGSLMAYVYVRKNGSHEAR
jgi:prepilin-type N-terminal cleavage/methylation domain